MKLKDDIHELGPNEWCAVANNEMKGFLFAPNTTTSISPKKVVVTLYSLSFPSIVLISSPPPPHFVPFPPNYLSP